MGEFIRSAEAIFQACWGIEEGDGARRVSVKDIGDIMGESFGEGHGMINLYPSEGKTGCCDTAFFVSLTGPYAYRMKGHLKFDQALGHFVQHMQGGCRGITRSAIIITDSLEPNALAKWYWNIKEVGKNAYVEMNLITTGGVLPIPL